MFRVAYVFGLMKERNVDEMDLKFITDQDSVTNLQVTWINDEYNYDKAYDEAIRAYQKCQENIESDQPLSIECISVIKVNGIKDIIDNAKILSGCVCSDYGNQDGFTFDKTIEDITIEDFIDDRCIFCLNARYLQEFGTIVDGLESLGGRLNHLDWNEELVSELNDIIDLDQKTVCHFDSLGIHTATMEYVWGSITNGNKILEKLESYVKQYNEDPKNEIKVDDVQDFISRTFVPYKLNNKVLVS